MHRVRAGDDAALRLPENRVIVVRARGDVDEEVEHRVVVHKRRGDGHGAGRHGESVLSASLVGQVERAAVLVGDRQRFERVALIGRDGDGHSAALGGRLWADGNAAVRAVRDRNVIVRRGWGSMVALLNSQCDTHRCYIYLTGLLSIFIAVVVLSYLFSKNSFTAARSIFCCVKSPLACLPRSSISITPQSLLVSVVT